jgi:hypothetical protein
MDRKEVESNVERISGADLLGPGVVPPPGPGILEQASQTKRLIVKIVQKHSFVNIWKKNRYFRHRSLGERNKLKS